MTVISKEIDYVFSSNCHAYKTMNTQYDNSYEAFGAAAGSTIQIKQPHRVIVNDGRVISTVSDDEERTVSLPRATWRNVNIEMNGSELAVDLTKAEAAASFFGKTRLAAAVQALAADVDSTTYANVMPQVYSFTRGTATTNPSAYSDIGEIKAKLDDHRAPQGDRSFVMTNQTMVSLNNATSGFFNPAGKKSEDYMTGELGDVNGFTCYNSTNLPRHTNGTATAGAVKTTLSVQGVNQMVVDGLSTGTVVAGDRFTIASVYRRDYVTKAVTGDLQQFVVTAATATVGGESTVTFYPAIETLATNAYASVDSFPQADAVVTFAGRRGLSQSQSVAYHRDAFVLAFVDAPKINCTYETYIKDSDTGLSMKLTGQGDILNLKSVFRLDVLFGSVAVNPWWACIVYGA